MHFRGPVVDSLASTSSTIRFVFFLEYSSKIMKIGIRGAYSELPYGNCDQVFGQNSNDLIFDFMSSFAMQAYVMI